MALGIVAAFTYLKAAHDNTPEGKEDGNPANWAWNPFDWSGENTTVIVGVQGDSDGNITGYTGLMDPSSGSGFVGGYNTDHGWGAESTSGSGNHQFYYPSINYNAPEQNAINGITTGINNYYNQEASFQQFKQEYWAQRTRIDVGPLIYNGWEYDYSNTPVAQTLSLDVNVNAFGGGGFSVGYAFDYYGKGGWYIGSNVHAGEPGAGVGLNSTVYRYTGNTDWDISILEGDAYYWQAGGTIGPGWAGVDVEYNRTWNKQAGFKGDGIYVGVGVSLVPFVNGSVGYSMMDILRIKR